MLDQDQLDHFEKHGFVTVEGLIDDDALENLRSEYSALVDQLYDGWFERGLVKRAPQGLSFWDKLTSCCKSDVDWFQPLDISLPLGGIADDTPMHFGPAVFDLLTHPSLLDTVEQLIGPEITSNPIQHTRIKPPTGAVPKTESSPQIVETDWHQDMSSTLEEAHNSTMVTAWIAVTDATAENGCLQVSPGARDMLLPHCNNGEQIGLAETCMPELEPIPVPVKSGGALFLSSLTPHASLTNLSDGFRWSFDLRYSVTGHPAGRSLFPDFVARSRSQPWTELRDWERWLHRWQETRARLANESHILRHHWFDDTPCA